MFIFREVICKMTFNMQINVTMCSVMVLFHMGGIYGELLKDCYPLYLEKKENATVVLVCLTSQFQTNITARLWFLMILWFAPECNTIKFLTSYL